MTRIVTGPARRVRRRRPPRRRRVPRRPSPASGPRATARCARTFPTTSRRPRSIVQEAGGVVTDPTERRSTTHPAVGSGDGFGIAVVASASPALHERLLASVEAGMGRLGAWLRRPVMRGPVRTMTGYPLREVRPLVVSHRHRRHRRPGGPVLHRRVQRCRPAAEPRRPGVVADRACSSSAGTT